MNDSTTTLYNVDEFEERLIRETLEDVYKVVVLSFILITSTIISFSF